MHVTHTFSCAMAWVTFTWVTLHVIIAHAWPVVMERRKRSLVSSTRRQVIASGSMSSRTNLRSHHIMILTR